MERGGLRQDISGEINKMESQSAIIFSADANGRLHTFPTFCGTKSRCLEIFMSLAFPICSILLSFPFLFGIVKASA